ncbi:MAG: hypothetical protein WC261_14715 [Synergistaceae bacterium]|jgi:hypothetical protein
MKKIIAILIGFVFAVSAFGQVTARTADSRTLKGAQFFYEKAAIAADTVGTGQDSVIYEILVNKNTPVAIAVHVAATRTGTADDYEVRLQGKVFENDAYTSLVDSTAQTFATGKLSLYMPDVRIDTVQAASTPPFYRYFRVVLASDGTVAAADKLTVSKVQWKVWQR